MYGYWVGMLSRESGVGVHARCRIFPVSTNLGMFSANLWKLGHQNINFGMFSANLWKLGHQNINFGTFSANLWKLGHQNTNLWMFSANLWKLGYQNINESPIDCSRVLADRQTYSERNELIFCVSFRFLTEATTIKWTTMSELYVKIRGL